MPPEKKISRRDFFFSVGLLGFLGAILGYIAASFRFIFPNVLYEPPSTFKIGRPEQFPEGTVTFLEEDKLFVFHEREGFHVISAVCTHLGCTVRQEEKGFACPCHGSVFDKNGRVLKGPAPHPLEWYRLTLGRQGDLVVDTKMVVDPTFRLET